MTTDPTRSRISQTLLDLLDESDGQVDIHLERNDGKVRLVVSATHPCPHGRFFRDIALSRETIDQADCDVLAVELENARQVIRDYRSRSEATT